MICRKRHEACLKRPVDVTVLSLKWFFNERRNFVALSKSLQNLPNKFYTSDFMRFLLEEYWSSTKQKILITRFLPYLAFLMSAIMYFYYALNPTSNTEGVDEWSQDRILETVLGILTLALLIPQIFTEIKQMQAEDEKMDYFRKKLNWIDILSILMTLIIVVSSIISREASLLRLLRVMAACTSCLMFIKMYDWLRLFDSTSFYILLV